MNPTPTRLYMFRTPHSAWAFVHACGEEDIITGYPSFTDNSVEAPISERCEALAREWGAVEPRSNGRRFIPSWLAEARERCMVGKIVEDDGLVMSRIPAKGTWGHAWVGKGTATTLTASGWRLPAGSMPGNYGTHGEVGTRII